MAILTIIYILVFIIFALIAYAILQIKMFGMKIKDFWSFIEANQMLDKLYKFARQYENMSPQEQIIYLAEAEKILAVPKATTAVSVTAKFTPCGFMPRVSKFEPYAIQMVFFCIGVIYP